MQSTNFFEFNKPDLSDPVDIRKINNNFDAIDQALMAALITKQKVANEMGGTEEEGTLIKAWPPMIVFRNGNDFDVTIKNRGVEMADPIIVKAHDSNSIFFKSTLYPMDFEVDGGHEITFEWLVSAEEAISEIVERLNKAGI